MSSPKSLPPVSAKVIADCEKFIADFKRADNESRRSMGNIDKEIDKFTKNVSKKMTVSDIGKSLLGGLGFGSGFAAASTVIGVITDHFREQEQHLKNMEDIWERMQKRSLDYSRSLMDPLGQMESMNAEMDELQKKYIELASPKTQRIFVGGQNAGKWIEQIIPKTNEETEALGKLVEQMQILGIEVDKINRKVEETKRAASVQNALTDFFGSLDAIDPSMQAAAARRADEVKALERSTAAQQRFNEQLARSADGYRKMIDPGFELSRQLEEIDDLFWAGHLNADEAAASIDAVTAAAEKLKAQNVDRALKDFFGDLDEKSTTMKTGVQEKVSSFTREMSMMWENVSDRAGQAFADMVLTGENAFKKLPELAARAALEIIARMAIINPLMNMLFSGFSGFNVLPAFFGMGATTGTAPGRARGGAVEPGVTYRVNEEGQEFFRSGVGGTVMPVGTARGMRGAAGITYAPVINVAAGITRQELLPALMPILREHGRALTAMIEDSLNRGGSFADAAG